MRTITWHPWHPWHPTKREKEKTSTQKCLSNGRCQFPGGYVQGKCICIEKYVCICMYKHLNIHTCIPGCNIIVQPTPSDLNVNRLTGQVRSRKKNNLPSRICQSIWRLYNFTIWPSKNIHSWTMLKDNIKTWRTKSDALPKTNSEFTHEKWGLEDDPFLFGFRSIFRDYLKLQQCTNQLPLVAFPIWQTCPASGIASGSSKSAPQGVWSSFTCFTASQRTATDFFWLKSMNNPVARVVSKLKCCACWCKQIINKKTPGCSLAPLSTKTQCGSQHKRRTHSLN